MHDIPILVIIPLYNARPYINQAIDSILEQTYKNLRLLVIDDGSSDDGDKLVAKRQDSRIVLWRQVNSGPGSAMNRAIEYARENGYPFIARMDSDDISLPRRLEVQVKLLSSVDKTVAACSSNCYYIEENTEQIIGTSTVPLSPALIKWEIENGLRGLIQPSLLARTEALAVVGGYRHEFRLAEETDLFLRLSERFTFINSPEFLCKIRLRHNSLSVQNTDENSWYLLYALQCKKWRKRGVAEKTYKEFRATAGLTTRYWYWREHWLLVQWRKHLIRSNFFSLLVAGFIDPRRVLSRLLRVLEAFFYKES